MHKTITAHISHKYFGTSYHSAFMKNEGFSGNKTMASTIDSEIQRCDNLKANLPMKHQQGIFMGPTFSFSNQLFAFLNSIVLKLVARACYKSQN
jgi:hypothetical protein